jgi:hypothetical protein
MTVGIEEITGPLDPAEAAWQERVALLDDAPGVDPLVALHEGREVDIPQAGYLIRIHVEPNQQAAVDLFRYPEGGLSLRGSDLYYGEDSSNVRASLRGHAETLVLCTRRIGAKEEHVIYDTVLPVQDSTPTPLSEGLYMVTQNEPRNSGTGHGISLRTCRPLGASRSFSRVQAVRGVHTAEEAYEVCVVVGLSMGLEGEALDTFTSGMAEQIDKIGPEEPRHIPTGALGALITREERPV